MYPLQTSSESSWQKTKKLPPLYHHKKYNLLTFDSFLCFADMCLMYKLTHNLAPPSLKQCVSFCRDNVRVTRASVRGDCYTQFRKTKFGQSAFSFTVVEKWNLIPLHIRDCASLSSLKMSLKTWLKANQCDHWPFYNMECIFVFWFMYE